MKSNLFKRGFVALSVTQMLGAANDNLLKGVLSFSVVLGGAWSGQLGDAGQSYVALCLTLPFIFLSGLAGQIADRYSKATVTVAIKVLEVLIALVALASFMLGNVWLAMVAMVLLGTQSAFFGPAKYGMIPELVRPDELSRANGAINMCTNISIIFGAWLAGPVYLAFYPASDPIAVASGVLPDAKTWLPGVILLIIAGMGIVSAVGIPRLKACQPRLGFSMDLTRTYRETIKEMLGTNLFTVAIAWSLFYMIGMLALLILPDYKALLVIDPVEASILMAILGIAIGIGSVSAGLLSGHHIEPRLIPFGAVGMAISFTALGFIPLNYWMVAAFLTVAGFSAGFYIVPLQALLQFLSPDAERGRFLGTANAMSFVCSTIGIGVFWVAREVFGLPSNRVFVICGVSALVGSASLLWLMRGLLGNASRFKNLGQMPEQCLNCNESLSAHMSTGACPKCGVRYVHTELADVVAE